MEKVSQYQEEITTTEAKIGSTNILSVSAFVAAQALGALGCATPKAGVYFVHPSGYELEKDCKEAGSHVEREGEQVVKRLELQCQELGKVHAEATCEKPLWKIQGAPEGKNLVFDQCGSKWKLRKLILPNHNGAKITIEPN